MEKYIQWFCFKKTNKFCKKQNVCQCTRYPNPIFDNCLVNQLKIYFCQKTKAKNNFRHKNYQIESSFKMALVIVRLDIHVQDNSVHFMLITDFIEGILLHFNNIFKLHNILSNFD